MMPGRAPDPAPRSRTVRASHTSPSVSTAVDIDHPALKNPDLRPSGVGHCRGHRFSTCARRRHRPVMTTRTPGESPFWGSGPFSAAGVM
jgi:hypothetical protein